MTLGFTLADVEWTARRYVTPHFFAVLMVTMAFVTFVAVQVGQREGYAEWRAADRYARANPALHVLVRELPGDWHLRGTIGEGRTWEWTEVELNA